MKYLTMWVCELGGYWGWLSSSRFLILFYSDWPNAKEKTPHILKVTQHQNVYPRSVVDFFSKSCFVLIAFMNVIFKHGNFLQFPLGIWQNLQKKSQKDLSSICMQFCFIATMQKFTPNKPLTITIPNSSVPKSTFGTTKTPP
jgi:hypothetical protein